MSFYFFSGKTDKANSIAEEEKRLGFIKEKFSELLELKNLSFLLGAGCSSLIVGTENIGIPTMEHLADEFCGKISGDAILEKFRGGKVKNLEDFLNYLYRKIQSLEDEEDTKDIEDYRRLIDQTKLFIFEQCSNKNSTVREIYKTFYKKLMLRNGSLPKVNIFTTNYDLFSELALEEIGVNYNNGFTGFHNRTFNPGIFKHGLYAELESKGTPLMPIDNQVFLYKLHGSIRWIKKPSHH